MSAAALTVARDEADILETAVGYSLRHFDEVIAVDHLSVDGTRELLRELPVHLAYTIDDRAFRGDDIWTRMAYIALERGHEWAAVVDADEVWHPTVDPTMRVADLLAGVPDDMLVVRGRPWNHIPTGDDDETVADPVARIGWRERTPCGIKAAFRCRPGMSFSCHNAWYDGEVPRATEGLVVRHFSIRTAAQLVHKVRVGMDGYSVEAGFEPGEDWQWQQWKGLTDSEIAARFLEPQFYAADPADRADLVYDPAPPPPAA